MTRAPDKGLITGDATAQQRSAPQHGQTLDSSARRSSLFDAAAPLACSSFSDPGTCMLPITQHPSFRRPMEEVVLRIECAGDRSVRVGVACAKVVGFIGASILLLLMVLRFRRSDDWFLRDNTVYILNVALGSLCLAALFTCVVVFGHRLLRVRKSGKRWARRRAFFSLITYSQLVVQFVSCVFFVWPMIYLLTDNCSWFASAVRWATVVRWQCTGLLFLSFSVQAHAVTPWRNPEAPKADALNIDNMSLIRSFWPFMVLAAVFAVLVFAVGIVLQFEEDAFRASTNPVQTRTVRVPVGKCVSGELRCPLSAHTFALKLLCTCLLVCFLLLWTIMIIRALRRISRDGLQAQHKIAALSIRIELRNKAFPVAFFALCFVLLGYIHPESCAAFVLAWLGLMPVVVVLTIVVITSALTYLPTDPNAATAPVLQVWLQEFAWTEKDHKRKMAERRLQRNHPSQFRDAPMFVFEIAIRMFYWSMLIYRHQENHKDQSITIDTAMQLCGLEEFELLWERAEDTKVLLAWSGSSIVLSFRGTASWANVLADLQFWLTEHPPIRGRGTWFCGSRPYVHAGFLRSWQANGLNQKLLQRIKDIVKSSVTAGLPRHTVYVTGHSLGGALATLAAYDIAALWPTMAVSCYTFGAPRTGNRAFAVDYGRMVADTWHVINDQDLVTRGAKFGVYKRPGHRVLLSGGNILVRPSHVEVSLHHMPFGSSPRDHQTASYKVALSAVLLQQMDMRQSPQSMQELHDLLAVMRDIRIAAPEEPRGWKRLAKFGGASLAAFGMSTTGTMAAVAADEAPPDDGDPLLQGDPDIFAQVSQPEVDEGSASDAAEPEQGQDAAPAAESPRPTSAADMDPACAAAAAPDFREPGVQRAQSEHPVRLARSSVSATWNRLTNWSVSGGRPGGFGPGSSRGRSSGNGRRAGGIVTSGTFRRLDTMRQPPAAGEGPAAGLGSGAGSRVERISEGAA